MSKFGRKIKSPPPGFEYVEATLSALDTELREQVNAPHEGLRKTESQWPVHQINWQRSRYIYDLYYTYEKISREVYDYCISHKLADAALIAKWKKPGYERLCSTYAINPRNYKFGTVSICRVPRHALPPGTEIEDPNTGCRGCASGSGGNIFGNKYGQYLAAIQVARGERVARQTHAAAADDDADDDVQNDDEDDEDEPGPQVGSKRSGQQLSSQAKKVQIAQLGPVGAADGGTGEGESVWADAADEEIELDSGMIGQYVGEAEKESRAAARSLGKSGGGGGGGVGGRGGGGGGGGRGY